MYRNVILLYKHTHTPGEIMKFGRKQEWHDYIIILLILYVYYVHRGHGHVRPELTDEARLGGRIKKKIIIITIMASMNYWRADDNSDNNMMVINVRRYTYIRQKLTTFKYYCYILYMMCIL